MFLMAVEEDLVFCLQLSKFHFNVSFYPVAVLFLLLLSCILDLFIIQQGRIVDVSLQFARFGRRIKHDQLPRLTVSSLKYQIILFAHEICIFIGVIITLFYPFTTKQRFFSSYNKSNFYQQSDKEDYRYICDVCRSLNCIT